MRVGEARVDRQIGKSGVNIFAFPPVCRVEKLQVQFQALYLLLSGQPTNFLGGPCTGYVPHIQLMWLTLQMNGPVWVNFSFIPPRMHLSIEI